MTGCKYCTEYEDLPEEWTEDGPRGTVTGKEAFSVVYFSLKSFYNM